MTALRLPAAPLRPDAGEVHVWTARVSTLAPEEGGLRNVLSPEERATAARFVRPDDARRYVIAHGLLRRVLGAALARPPEAIAMTPGSHGKPALAGTDASAGLHFNLSHSGDLVACALATGLAVGVDIEALRADLDLDLLARTCFSAAERAELAAEPESGRRAAFFRGWTRKEAYLKARGIGFGFPLDRFSVSLAAVTSPTLRWVEDDAGAPERWSLFDLGLGADYAGAVACEGKDIRFMVRNWEA